MKRTILLPTLLVSLLTAAAAPRIADACGPETVPVKLAKKPKPTKGQVRDLVEAHFAAIAAGDSDTVLALWDAKAKVKSLDGAGKVLRTVALEKALARWIDKREGMSWTIGLVTERTKRGSFDVQVAVTWDGVVYQDVLGVRSDADGNLRLVSKASTPRDAERPKSPY